MGALSHKALAILLCLLSLTHVRSSIAQQEPGNQAPSGPNTGDQTASPAEARDLEPTSPELPAPTTAQSSEPAKAPAVQDGEADARAAFQEGDRLYYEGDYQGAVLQFEQAYAMSGRIEMLFNLANAHERLGNYTEASVALRGYIPHAPPSGRESLERRLSRLERLAEEQRALPPPSPPLIEQSAPPPVKMIPFNRAIGIGLVTLGGVSLALGVGFAVSAGNARGELSEMCVEGASGQLCPEAAEPYVKKDKSHSIAADVSFIAGAALSISGVYLVLKKTDKGEITAKAGPGNLLLEGSF